MSFLETPQRIEPALLEGSVPLSISDAIADLKVAADKLGNSLHPRTAMSLADLVRLMNSYYSNLIEGHNTLPKDIELGMQNKLDHDPERRNLQLEAVAHIRVQSYLDSLAAIDHLPEPASADFIRDIHRRFYENAPESMLTINGHGREIVMVPGEWRSKTEHDVMVGRHIPPSSERIDDFMSYFASRYRFSMMGSSQRIIAIAAAHHRFNYIHPFADGNGRVSRLMSHAMAHEAGIGAYGLWSVSRGLARGLESRSEYKAKMDHADTPRQGSLDGRGNLSERALSDFIEWFLKVCLDQVIFMSGLFELDALKHRLRRYVEISGVLKPEAGMLLEEALIRGQIDRGDCARILRLPERTARRILADVIAEGLLVSETPKGPLFLAFPTKTQDILFPRLFPHS